MTTSATESVSPSPASHWQPDGDAHLIYRWVKFEGKSQSWVASAFRVSQSTISRIIQRYERWQAHAKERENGRLDCAERLRAQRWLTYERNELILASCLRIAGDLEGSLDTSRSTILHHASDPSRELEVRTQHACIDRTGMVSRFLRLAHRINMEQLKLAAAIDPPVPEPLSPEELALEEAQAAADAAELAAARHKGSREKGSGVFGENDSSMIDGRSSPKTPDPLAPEPAASAPATEQCGGRGEETGASPTEGPSDGETEGSAQQPPTHHSPAAGALHNLHNENSPEFAATTSQPCTCTLEVRIQKNSSGACITDQTGSGDSGETSPAPREESNSPNSHDSLAASSAAG